MIPTASQSAGQAYFSSPISSQSSVPPSVPSLVSLPSRLLSRLLSRLPSASCPVSRQPSVPSAPPIPFPTLLSFSCPCPCFCPSVPFSAPPPFLPSLRHCTVVDIPIGVAGPAELKLIPCRNFQYKTLQKLSTYTKHSKHKIRSKFQKLIRYKNALND